MVLLFAVRVGVEGKGNVSQILSQSCCRFSTVLLAEQGFRATRGRNGGSDLERTGGLVLQQHCYFPSYATGVHKLVHND